MTVLFMNLLFFLRIKLRIPLGRVLLQVHTQQLYMSKRPEQEALQVSLLLCALCALPLSCSRSRTPKTVVYWLFVASPCSHALEYRTPTCALPLSCPARMLPLAYAGPPTHLCTVACTVDNNPITIFVNLSSLIHVLNTNLHTNFPRDTSRSKLSAKLRIPLCSSVRLFVCSGDGNWRDIGRAWTCLDMPATNRA